MEHKTRINAEDGRQDIIITREFDLPVDLLYKAHTDPDLFEQWMTHEYATTKVLKLEAKPHGSWQFETRDAQGNKVFGANGVIHECIQDSRITRTFEMENTPFPVQLEFLEFTRLSDEQSRFTMQIVYRTREARDNMLQLPFQQGLHMAHNRLQEIIGKLK